MSKPTTNNLPPSTAALGAFFTKLQNHEPDIAHLIRTATTFVPPPKDAFANKLYDIILPEILKFDKAYWHPEHGEILKINPHLRTNRLERMLQTIRNIQKSVPRPILWMLKAINTDIPADLSLLAIMNERLWDLGNYRLSNCLEYVWTAAQMPSVPMYTTLTTAKRRELFLLFRDLKRKFSRHVGEYDYAVENAHCDLTEWKEKRGETFLPDPENTDEDDDYDW